MSTNPGKSVFPFGLFRASFGSGPITQNDKYPSNEVPVIGRRLNGVVTHVDSPACFYVVLSDDSQRLQDIYRNLQLVIPTGPASTMYKTGMPVAATNNNVWHRAEIVQYEEGSTVAKVFYVDYGETVDQTLDTIRPLPRSLVSTPPLARKCGLIGLKGHTQWTMPESQMFYKMVCALNGNEKILDVAVVGTNSRDNTVQVELFGDDHQNVNNLFVENLKTSGFQDPTLTVSVPFTYRPSFQRPIDSSSPQMSFVSYQSSSNDQPFPVGSSVPQKSGVGSFVPQQGSVSSLMPQLTARGSSVPQQGPVTSLMPQLTARGSSVPQQGPVSSLVPQLTARGSSVPQQGPVSSLVPQLTARGSSVLQQGIVGSGAQRNLIGSSVTQSRTSSSFMVGQQNASGQNLSIETPSRVCTPSQIPDIGSNLQTASALSYEEFTQVQLLGQTFKVELSFVNSPEDFYVAIQYSLTGENCGRKLKAMVEIMNQFYQKVPLNAMLLDPVQVGMPCAAAFSVDRRYYRAQVVDCSSTDSYTVHFVDFGNTETVPAKFCKQLRPDFLRSCPKLAIESSLKDAWPVGKQKEWPTEANGIMEDYLESDFNCKFLNVNRKGSYEVEIFSLEEKLDLLQILIRRNAADPNLKSQIVPIVPSTSVTRSIQLQPSFTTPFKRLELESGQSIGKVTMVVCNGPEDMFIHMDIYGEKLEQISQQCQEETPNVAPLPPRPYPARMACLALFETENTYNRAEVEEDMGSGGVRVYFVDFGNQSVCQPSQIRSMPDCEIFRTQALAVNVKLDGIVGKKDENDCFPKPYEDVFSNMVDSGNCQCSVIRKEPSGKYVINLRLPNEESVAEKLVVSEYAIREASEEVCTLISASTGFKLHLEINLPDLEISMISIEDSMDVTVTFIQDAATMNVQLSENKDLIADMTNRMRMVYIDALDEQKVVVNPRKGQICAVKYVDGQWYRACVLQRPSPSAIQVYFLDYGNVETVVKEFIKELSAEFMNIAPQALLIHLNGVDNASRSDERLKINLQLKEVWIKLESIIPYHDGLVVSMSHLLSDGSIININEIAGGRARWPEIETLNPTPSAAIPQSTPTTTQGDQEWTIVPVKRSTMVDTLEARLPQIETHPNPTPTSALPQSIPTIVQGEEESTLTIVPVKRSAVVDKFGEDGGVDNAHSGREGSLSGGFGLTDSSRTCTRTGVSGLGRGSGFHGAGSGFGSG